MEKLVHAHGGDLDAIEKQYHIPKSEIIDFSGNINPLGFPKSACDYLAKNIPLVCTYPDRKYQKLRQAIGAYTGANPEHIVVGNGSTELISVFIRTAQAEKTLILGPAYSEYEREVSLTGASFSYFPLKPEDEFLVDLPALLESLTPEIGLFIATNPNNPTGTALTKSQLAVLLEHCKQNHTAVMIDETYIEFSDSLEEICAIPLVDQFENLFVIRGTSKFFAAPGLRLGYGVTKNAQFHKLLSAEQDPWSVNMLAALAGEVLFTDQAFIAQTKALITSEREKAYKALSAFTTLHPYQTRTNFMLLRLQNTPLSAHDLFEALIQKKLLIRDAASFTFLDERYLRFCFQLPEQNAFLIQELSLLLEQSLPT